MKHHIICALFSFHFFIYAISPLSYSYEHKQLTNHSVVTVNGFRLFIVDILLSHRPHHEKKGDTSDAGILLKKKRATISEDKLKISKPQLKTIATVSDSLVSPKTPAIAMVAHNDEPGFQREFLQAHSGLSPPSV